MVIETGAMIIIATLAAAMGALAYVETLQEKIRKLENRMVRYENFICSQTSNQVLDSRPNGNRL